MIFLYKIRNFIKIGNWAIWLFFKDGEIILPMCQKRTLHHPAIILSVYYQVFQFRKSLLEPYHKLQDFHWQLLRKNEK